MLCNVAGPCTNIVTKSQIWDVLEYVTTSTLCLEKVFHATVTQPALTVPGALRLGSNVPLIDGMVQTQSLAADVKHRNCRNTARVSRETADTFPVHVQLTDVSKCHNPANFSVITSVSVQKVTLAMVSSV